MLPNLLVTTNDFQSEVDQLAKRLAFGAIASGFNDLEDEDLKQAVLDDLQAIAEASIKRRLAEQAKRKKAIE